MIVQEEGEEDEEEEGGLSMPESFKSLQLSLFSMDGFTLAKSWKVGGELQAQTIIVIDCGASQFYFQGVGGEVAITSSRYSHTCRGRGGWAQGEMPREMQGTADPDAGFRHYPRLLFV